MTSINGITSGQNYLPLKTNQEQNSTNETANLRERLEISDRKKTLEKQRDALRREAKFYKILEYATYAPLLPLIVVGSLSGCSRPKPPEQNHEDLPNDSYSEGEGSPNDPYSDTTGEEGEVTGIGTGAVPCGNVYPTFGFIHGDDWRFYRINGPFLRPERTSMESSVQGSSVFGTYTTNNVVLEKADVDKRDDGTNPQTAFIRLHPSAETLRKGDCVIGMQCFARGNEPNPLAGLPKNDPQNPYYWLKDEDLSDGDQVPYFYNTGLAVQLPFYEPSNLAWNAKLFVSKTSGTKREGSYVPNPKDASVKIWTLDDPNKKPGLSQPMWLMNVNGEVLGFDVLPVITTTNPTEIKAFFAGNPLPENMTKEDLAAITVDPNNVPADGNIYLNKNRVDTNGNLIWSSYVSKEGPEAHRTEVLKFQLSLADDGTRPAQISSNLGVLMDYGNGNLATNYISSGDVIAGQLPLISPKVKVPIGFSFYDMKNPELFDTYQGTILENIPDEKKDNVKFCNVELNGNCATKADVDADDEAVFLNPSAENFLYPGAGSMFTCMSFQKADPTSAGYKPNDMVGSGTLGDPTRYINFDVNNNGILEETELEEAGKWYLWPSFAYEMNTYNFNDAKYRIVCLTADKNWTDNWTSETGIWPNAYLSPLSIIPFSTDYYGVVNPTVAYRPFNENSIPADYTIAFNPMPILNPANIKNISWQKFLSQPMEDSPENVPQITVLPNDAIPAETLPNISGPNNSKVPVYYFKQEALAQKPNGWNGPINGVPSYIKQANKAGTEYVGAIFSYYIPAALVGYNDETTSFIPSVTGVVTQTDENGDIVSAVPYKPGEIEDLTTANTSSIKSNPAIMRP